MRDSPADVKEAKAIELGRLLHDHLRKALDRNGWTCEKLMQDLNIDARELLVAYRRTDRAHVHLKVWNHRVKHGKPDATMDEDVEKKLQETYDTKVHGPRPI